MPRPVSRRLARDMSSAAGASCCSRPCLSRRFRLVLSCASVRRSLHQMGWRWARPRLAPARKPDPEAGTKRAALAQATELARQGVAHLLYLDESDLHLLPLIRSMWMKGPCRRIPTLHERKLAVHFVTFLQRLEAVYSTGPLYLALDNAPTHTAKVVGKWLAAHPRVHVLWLPRYAAHEVNPVERIWGLMKAAVAADRLAGSIEELTAAARRFFADLAPHPVKLPGAA